MKRPAKRHNRQSLLTAIDDEIHNNKMDLKLIGQYEAEIGELKKWFAANDRPVGIVDSFFSERWHDKNDRLQLCKTEMALRIKRLPYHAGKLLALKGALAEFDTEPMAFLIDSTVTL